VRLGHDAVAHPLVERSGDRRVKERPGIGVAQATDRERVEGGQLVGGGRLAHGEDERHRPGHQPAGDEGQRLGRGAVQPLGVVDDAHQRALVGHPGEQAQHGEPDEQAVRRRPVAQAEGGGQRVALRRRQRCEPILERGAELLQAGERDLGLGLHARGARDVAVRRGLDQVLQQRGLADARLAAQDEHLAASRAHGFQQPVQRLALAAPSTQGRSRVAARSRHRGEARVGAVGKQPSPRAPRAPLGCRPAARVERGSRWESGAVAPL
jgi:hypothetical protein